MQNQGKLARSKIITSRLSLSGKVREQFYDNIPGLNYKTLWYIMLLEFVFIISRDDYIVDFQHHATKLCSQHQLLSLAN